MHTEDSPAIRRIVVVGGGSAGWLTAGLIAARHAAGGEPAVSVTLIESPQIATIGVGEGTWPTMRATLQQLGINEATFLRECTATFKQGTRFQGWVDGSEHDAYYHPFSPPAGYPTLALAEHWCRRDSGLSFVDSVSPQGMICDRRLGPKQIQTPAYAGVVNYGYHLDAGRFAALLTRHCTEQLGVHHIQDHIESVNSTENGDIASLQTAGQGAIAGDLFIDCSGMRAMLLGQHFGIGLEDQSSILFNNTALAVQAPYTDETAPIESLTLSTAQAAGWIWDIGLTQRRGVGYVYSNAHTTESEAQSALEAYLRASGANVDQLPSPRRIDFTPAYRERFWHRNCVAVGMASGFIEPLEASALVMVELSARMIVEELPANRAVMDVVARRFNDKFRYRWERIIEFLKLHYLLSQRHDSQYWRDNRRPDSVPERLRDDLQLWQQRAPSQSDFPEVDEIFSAASYQYVLYGMGWRPTQPRTLVPDGRVEQLLEQNRRAASQALAALPDHRTLLSTIGDSGLPAAG